MRTKEKLIQFLNLLNIVICLPYFYVLEFSEQTSAIIIAEIFVFMVAVLNLLCVIDSIRKV